MHMHILIFQYSSANYLKTINTSMRSIQYYLIDIKYSGKRPIKIIIQYR